ncbi:MAG: integrase [Proteobacteria bacterium]|nr:MAG: integrase [Pseudomonadota bacterium]
MNITDPKLAKSKPKTKAYRIQIGDNAYLEVSPKGRKTWRMRYRRPSTGKEAIMTLGRYCDADDKDAKGRKKPKPDWHVSLADARQRVAEAKGLLGQGIDPAEHRKQQQEEKEREAQIKEQEKANAFENVAREWHQHRMNSMKKWSEKHAVHILNRLELHVFPKIGAIPIRELTAPQLLDNVIQPIVDRGNIETAKKVSQWINAIFRYAVIRKLVAHNEADNLRDELPSTPAVNNPHLTTEQIPDFIKAVEAGDMGEVVKIAILFTMHTLARTGETRYAQWAEFNFDEHIWQIPAERMKMNRPHMVPLSSQVLALLEQLRAFTGQYDYLFVTRGWNKPMSENAMLYALYRLNYKGRLTIHGLRGTGSTILNEAGFRKDVVEAALAHVDDNKIRGAYNHAQYLEERREMLQWYSEYLDGLKEGAQVIPINRKRA